MQTILAADIGGTHSRFAHFRTDPETALKSGKSGGMTLYPGFSAGG